jgi:Holliday junction resolvase YEN1
MRSTASYIVDLGSPEPSDDETDLPVLGQRSTAPSRVDPAIGAMPFEVPDEEDEDLQSALRLSKHESIFAMREAGRVVHGLSMPAWSLDQSTSHNTSSPTSYASTREAPTAILYRPGRPARVTLPGVIGVASASTSDWSSTTPAIISGKPAKVTRPYAGDTAYSEPAVLENPNPTAADIRAARLRHFAAASTSTTAPNENVSKPVSLPLVATLPKRATSSYQIPVGADYIDLTDDWSSSVHSKLYVQTIRHASVECLHHNSNSIDYEDVYSPEPCTAP